MDGFARKLLKNVFALGISIVAGVMLLTLVYLIPVSAMKVNASVSSETLSTEGDYFQVSLPGGVVTATLDNYTDALMIDMACAPNDGNAFINGLKTTKYVDESKQSVDCLSLIVNGETNQLTAVPYTRYWGGFLVILKPLLVLMNYSQIRILNAVVQCLLLALVFFLMVKKKQKRLIIPYILFLCGLEAYFIFMSLQFSTVFYITLISTIVLLKFYEKMNEKKLIPLFFCVIGIATSYFDLLTYPLVAMAVPLAILFVLKKDGLKESLREGAADIGSWAMGYLGVLDAQMADSNDIPEDGCIFRRIYGSGDEDRKPGLGADNQLLAGTGGKFRHHELCLFPDVSDHRSHRMAVYELCVRIQRY